MGSAMRRYKRGNVSTLTGQKFRKGNKGQKLERLQLIVLKDNIIQYLVGKRIINSINRCKVRITKTILHDAD